MKLLTVAALTGGALAQSGAWGQCGGQGWSGATTCVAGYTCTFSNPWYSQCLPGSAPPPPASTTTTSSARPSTTSSATTLQTSTRVTTSSSGSSPTSVPGAFEWYGANESGGEFGEGTLPGQWGKHFIFPDPAAVSTLRRDGYNTFRVQFKMERLSQSTLTGSFDAAYLRNLTDSVNHITNSGGIAVLDPHNYGRYFGNVITSTADFRTWWRNVATQFASNPRVVFDTNNEYHTMDQNLVDPLNKIVYQMHQYLDSDSSGTSPNCVSGTIGRERLIAATNWLRANKKVGILGEFAGGANPTCRTAVTGLLDHLAANKDVWRGFLWWAAGPWWGDYMYSFEPPSGTGYVNYNSLLKQYIP